MARIKTTFKDAGTLDGIPIVVCILTDGVLKAGAIAAHPDYLEAARRAFARARGTLFQ